MSAMVSDVPSLAVDQAGHGRRRADSGPYTVAWFADDLAAELRRRPDVQYILVGHTLGGAVYAEVARLLANRVSHVLAMDSLLHPMLYPRLGTRMMWFYSHALSYAFKPFIRAMLRGSYIAGTPQWGQG